MFREIKETGEINAVRQKKSIEYITTHSRLINQSESWILYETQSEPVFKKKHGEKSGSKGTIKRAWEARALGQSLLERTPYFSIPWTISSPRTLPHMLYTFSTCDS